MYSLTISPIVNYEHVSDSMYVGLLGGGQLASDLCEIVYLGNLCLGCLILLRNVFVLGTNTWISIFKWIRNEDSKFNIKYKAEQTLKLSFANPPFLAA